MSIRSLVSSFVAVLAVSVSAFAADCNVPAPCGPATPSCEISAPVCAPAQICVPCINPFAVVRGAACTVVNAAANVQARLACLKPCVSIAPCAPAACAPCAPTCDVPEVKPCEPAACTAEPVSCEPCKVSCCIKPFQRLKAAFARPCFAIPSCVAPCAPASCEAPAPAACAPVAPCAPATGC